MATDASTDNPITTILSAHETRLRGDPTTSVSLFDEALPNYARRRGAHRPYTLRALGRMAETAEAALAVMTATREPAAGNDWGKHPAGGQLLTPG